MFLAVVQPRSGLSSTDALSNGRLGGSMGS
jgi:hypothetical protein